MGIYAEVKGLEIHFGYETQGAFLPPWGFGLWFAWPFREALELLGFDWGRQGAAWVAHLYEKVSLQQTGGFGATAEALFPKRISREPVESPLRLHCLQGC
jgi:hypothetical protein